MSLTGNFLMNQFTILMYHMIREPENRHEARFACPPERFRNHMQQLSDNGFLPITLNQALEAVISESAIPEKCVVITLDDGYEDNYTNAFPILEEFSIPASIFLATGQVSGHNKWMDHGPTPQRPIMNWEQISEMHRHGIGFGAHSVTHPRLTELDNKSVRIEVEDSKKEIEHRLGKPCDHFAYPYGLFSDETIKIVKESGFSLACSTKSGFNNKARDPFTLHRIEVYGDDGWWRLKQKLTFGTNDSSLMFPLKYYTSRLMDRLDQQ